ncbi:predicted protein [Naegleria gruberi]|uniref:Predicted protein n=1 Tax=Naegleria gruberi TaxID=5762 RepID=D2V3P6_NAEGR|nr:uncharacterized protein NAEGRDRAFT_63440 [Naegleria gruberi]EFC48808.1 predicted protein [Naegleria gruberi]|eukprot:XP_002681552.1 predicted protein [Naegleria gruberi strain NEG-M]
MKSLTTSILFSILLLITLLTSCIQLSESKRIISQHDQDDIHLVIQLHFGNGKPKVTVHKGPVYTKGLKTNPFKSPEIMQESQDIIQQAKKVIPKKVETGIANDFLGFAEKLNTMYKAIPDEEKTKAVKDKLMKYIESLTKKSSHPTSDILKGSLNDISKESTSRKSSKMRRNKNGGASTLFIGKKFKDTFRKVSDKTKSFVSKAQQAWNEKAGQFIDNIGTYSDKVNSIGSKLTTDISQELQNLGFPKLANFALDLGKGIQKFSSTKLGPLEGKLKDKVIPFIKNTSGKIKETIGLIKGTISQFKAFKNVKFPKKFKDIKSSIAQFKEAAKNFNGKIVKENAGKIRGNIKQLVGSFKRKK